MSKATTPQQLFKKIKQDRTLLKYLEQMNSQVSNSLKEKESTEFIQIYQEAGLEPLSIKFEEPKQTQKKNNQQKGNKKSQNQNNKKQQQNQNQNKNQKQLNLNNFLNEFQTQINSNSKETELEKQKQYQNLTFEEKIKVLKQRGLDDNKARSCLKEAGGNVDLAVGLYLSKQIVLNNN
ncbi:hypothetical protein M0812_09082 [Anaeramoeba flamelloides]|uniref:UBA domain-containing protein n=1 Tax=Anaeramoeba flamelloides TaxID=1746091 RepID=A0AAV7ZNR3_9EUKA|nr:hypothetical protein M0812_09082 [Anaeramoeba flamelloides]